MGYLSRYLIVTKLFLSRGLTLKAIGICIELSSLMNDAIVEFFEFQTPTNEFRVLKKTGIGEADDQ